MEFTAVVFCGRGKTLEPFSEARGTGLPKALLPIANEPMINYVLDWCQRAVLAKILVVTQEETSESVEATIEKYKKSRRERFAKESDGSEATKYTTPIEIMPFTAENSAQIIYQLYKNTQFRSHTQNIMILPCDFITDLPPAVIIEAFRNRNESDVGVYFTYKNQLEIEDKKSKIFGKKYTVYDGDADDSCLLDVYGKADIEMSKFLRIRTQMSWRYPRSIVSTKLLNSGIFLASNRIFNIIDESPSKFSELYFERRNYDKFIRDLARRSWKHSKSKETVGLFVVPSEATFIRVNNLPVLMEANRQFMKKQAMMKGQTLQGLQSKDKLAAHVGNDSIVGDGTELGEKTNVKRSVVGHNCTIGKKVRITGSLILDNVTIGDDVQLENCIIGHHVKIQPKSKLINCNVESTNDVPTGTQAKGDTLLCLNLEAVEDGESEEEFVLKTGPLSDSSSDEDDDDEDDTSEDESEFEDEYTANDDGLFAY
ncbi:GCD1 [Candida theae]|uniref:Translation initiation factor eIF2B subunit gamma n=1 Tax=Candida theae TaxID=1198502 RepID=A0AAD5B9R0_9ASCO|nr:GCD1 [Candida theae]KAI5948907.1 GCD1 [Candida theae]